VAATAVARDSLFGGSLAYVPVAAAMFPGHSLLIVGRGFLAGRRRFTAYGLVVGLDAVGKLLGASVVALAGLGPVALSWALVLPPVVVLLARPFAAVDTAEAPRRPPTSDRWFVGGYVIAAAASQTILAAGPLVVAALGASPSEVSVFFVTTTLFRGPMTASYNMVARVLPGFTRLAAGGGDRELDHWAQRIGLGGLIGAAAAAILAAPIGPIIVAVLYGSDFRPPAMLASLAAAGVVAGMAGLGTMQILVARGATNRMAGVWLVSLAASAVAIVLAPGAPGIRVVAGFVTGEITALVGLSVAALLHREPGASDHEATSPMV
jgi:O-antigen/teichoic acid export membrane protein